MRYIGLVFFVFSTAIVYSQDYSNLIENGKYSKVLKKSLKVLKKTPNSIEDLYFASVVTSRVGAGNLYSPKQAYDYYIKAKVEYVKETDDKKLLKLDKIPINYTSFRVLSDSIYTGGLNYSINTNTEESFIEFLSYFVEATDNYKNKAVIERNRLAFEKCKSLNTIVGYREFIKKYALAAEVSEAWKGIHALSFQESLAKNTIEGYEEFISKFPSAIQVQEAVEKIHFLSYELALKENNSSAFKSFIDKYPKSKQVTKAKEIFYLLEFKENTVQGSWESYRDFYENFEGLFVDIAKDSLIMLANYSGNAKNLLYCIINDIGDKGNLIQKYYDEISKDGELATLNFFKENFSSYLPLIEKFESDYELAQMASSIGLTSETYAPSINSEMEKRLKREGAKTGAITISLMWDNYNDIDLHCIDPNGEEIFFSHKNSRSGGELDVDMNAGGPNSNEPVENIYWENRKAKKGNYSVYINHYRNHNCYGCSDPTNYTVVVKQNNIVREFKGKITFGASKRLIYTFDFNNKNFGEIELSQENLIKLDQYIKNASGKELAFVALQKLINNDISSKNWQNAIAVLNKFESNFKNDSKFKQLKETLKEQINSSIKIEQLTSINTEMGEEYSPVVSGDSRNLFFCGYNRLDNFGGEDVYVSRKENNDWSAPEVVPGLSNEVSNDAIMSVSTDGSKAVLFHNGKLAYSEKSLEGWSQLAYFPDNINNCSWNGDAMISSDGNALIFSSVREQDGFGIDFSHNEFYHATQAYFSDLYVSIQTENGWSNPVNLGNAINTNFIERSPFLHPDMKTLYFSSDGHGGLGKLDVYMTTRLADSCWNCWTEPINLGKEINTISDDWGYRITTDGSMAYFSKKSNSASTDDLFRLTLPAHLRPDIVARIEGELKNSKNQPISATIRWEDLESNKLIGTSKSDPKDGTYFIVLPMGKNYGYFVEDSSYFPMAQNLDLRNTTNAVEVQKDIVAISFTDMINEKIAVPMNNLFFEKLKSNLLAASLPELNRIAKILKEKNIKVEISGHTDNVGSESMNQKLSEERANSVKNFLISQGVNPTLIQVIGFGFSKPKTTNETEEGKAENRRVEIRFISE
jgi:outer membrane protein OmpA-like peptidoglycan-associated protein